MTRKEIYKWMYSQIKAEEMRNVPVDAENPFYICIAGTRSQEVHIYGIDALCAELHKPYRVEAFSDDCDVHYFKYRGCKFFGLVDKV